MSDERPILFSDRGCPFAWRVRAMIDALGIDVDRRECLVGSKPLGIEGFSRHKRIPLWVEGDLVLSESRVMLEYLAQKHGVTTNQCSAAHTALRRQAMGMLDHTVVPLLPGGPIGDPSRLEDAARALRDAFRLAAPSADVFTWHVAPILWSLRRWHPNGRATAVLSADPEVYAWVDDALLIPSLAATAPDPVTFAADIARAREAGLIEAEVAP